VYYSILSEPITWTQKLVLAKLLSLQNERKGRAVTVTQKLLAEWLGTSVRSVKQAISELKKRKLISYAQKSAANVYKVSKKYSGKSVSIPNTVLAAPYTAERKLVFALFSRISKKGWIKIKLETLAKTLHMPLRTFYRHARMLMNDGIVNEKQENGKTLYKTMKV
jgi:CTP-dependent riboflavin kinase